MARAVPLAPRRAGRSRRRDERAGAALEGVVGGQGDERPRALAALAQPVVGDGLVLRQRVRSPARRPRPRAARRQPATAPAPRRHGVRGPHQVDVGLRRLRPAAACAGRSSSNTQSSSTDVLLQLLDSSGAATQGMPASRILSNAFSSTFRQATPTMASTWPRDDDLEDDRRALGDEHLVAEFLGLGLEVGDGAGAALLAVEAELVVVGRAALGVLEAVRQQQEPAVEGRWPPPARARTRWRRQTIAKPRYCSPRPMERSRRSAVSRVSWRVSASTCRASGRRRRRRRGCGRAARGSPARP